MPGKAVKRSYWDACVFIAFINHESGRQSVIRSLLEEAAAGAVEVVTSVLSIAEVAFAAQEKTGGKLSEVELARIDKLWTQPTPVRLAECHILIATDARKLMRDALGQGWVLRAPDAIHLSTAARLGCQEFLTYERYSKVGLVWAEISRITAW